MSEQEEISIAAHKFREFAVADFDDARKVFDDLGCLDFITDSESYRLVPAVWTYFFNSTLVLAGNLDGNRPVYAYYNPFQDAVLFTQWEMVGDRPAIRRADFQTASAFVQGKSGTQATAFGWIENSRQALVSHVLLKQSNDFIAAFERAFPPQGTSWKKLKPHKGVASVVAAVGARLGLVLQDLINIQTPGNPDCNPGLTAFLQAVNNGDAKAMGALLGNVEGLDADLVMKIPEPVRKKMVPTFALTNTTGSFVVLSSAHVPNLYLFLAYGPKPGMQLQAGGVGGFGI